MSTLKELVEKLEWYGFTDKHGHHLENCVDFLNLKASTETVSSIGSFGWALEHMKCGKRVMRRGNASLRGCLVRCGCSLTQDWIDAAEFEARVAEKLTLEEPCPLPENADLDECPYVTEDDGSAFSCRWCRLKRARIAVEEEMDQ